MGMTELKKQSKGLALLSGNQLKLLALVLMTIDHIGMLIFTKYRILRIIGRSALPIFAYMIAEGCTYTRSRRKYLTNIFLLGVVYQIVYWFVEHSLYMSIFITFTLSICMIYSIDYARKRENILAWIVPVLTAALAWILCEMLPEIPALKAFGYKIDYGFFGALMPVLIYLPKERYQKFIAAAAAVFLLYLDRRGVQVWAFLALIPLALYNGERGRLNIKTLFYVYYPAHLVLLEIISKLLK